MYCSKCGLQLPDDSKFCNSCGAQVANAPVSVAPAVGETRLENPYERDVTLLHLYDLRVLEMSKAKLDYNWTQVDNKIKNLGIAGNYSIPSKGSPEVKPTWIIGVFIAAVALLGVGWFIDALVSDVVLGWFGNSKSTLFMGIGTVLAVILGIIGVIMIIVRASQSTTESQNHQQRMAQYNYNLANDRQRVQREINERNRLIPIKDGIYSEWEKVGNILTDTYSANLVPSQFRNLYAVYYLYEFLSTSQETLKEALLHCDLDVIKQKLDVIISQQRELIIQQAITNAHLANIQKQNDEMLEHAIATEHNTAKAAQYAKVAAANTEAMVYVGVAQYISQNF
jgi:hypothetical protein